MRATDFEFRHRFWVIVLIFFVAFGCYTFERVNVVEWLLKTPVFSGLAHGHASRIATIHLIFAISAALVGATGWIRTWGTAYLDNKVVRDRKIHTDRLIADGPYRYVRNPLYLGSVLMAVGLAPMAPPIGSMVLVVAMVVFILRLIGREEPFLLEKQGDAYRSYLARVPQLIPSLRPRLPAREARPRWGQALVGEMGMGLLFAGSAAFAITLNPRLFEYIVWSGFALWAAARISVKRRAQRQRV